MLAEVVFYQNFSVDSPTLSLTVILWALCAGLCVGAVFFVFTRHLTSRLIKALVKAGCCDESSAKTVFEIGLKPTAYFSRSLRDFEALRKYVVIANAEECRKNKREGGLARLARFFKGGDTSVSYDLSAAKLYIPEDKRITAEVRYESKGNPYLISLLICAVFFLIGLGLSYCMPLLLELLDAAITGYKEL